MSEEKKTATVCVSVILGVECPYCDEYMDLNDNQYFEDWETAGEILKDFCDGNREEISHDIVCPKCGKEFEVNLIEY